MRFGSPLLWPAPNGQLTPRVLIPDYQGLFVWTGCVGVGPLRISAGSTAPAPCGGGFVNGFLLGRLAGSYGLGDFCVLADNHPPSQTWSASSRHWKAQRSVGGAFVSGPLAGSVHSAPRWPLLYRHSVTGSIRWRAGRESTRAFARSLPVGQGASLSECPTRRRVNQAMPNVGASFQVSPVGSAAHVNRRFILERQSRLMKPAPRNYRNRDGFHRALTISAAELENPRSAFHDDGRRHPRAEDVPAYLGLAGLPKPADVLRHSYVAPAPGTHAAPRLRQACGADEPYLQGGPASLSPPVERTRHALACWTPCRRDRLQPMRNRSALRRHLFRRRAARS